MLTRAEATQNGQRFAEQWDAEKHTVSQNSIEKFAQELNSLSNLPEPQKNALKGAELRGATDGLIQRKVLPNLDVEEGRTNMRKCRVVGLTADGDKNLANDDLVIAIGRKKDDASKAENVVILGQDGKFYEARQVKNGYLRSDVVIAENAEDLERKYNPGKPVEIAKDKGNAADLEVFRKELHDFQRYSPLSEETAQRELDRLARVYSELSKEQQKTAFKDVMTINESVYNDVWLRGFFASRPQLAIQRGADGTIRFSAGWTDGTSLFLRPRNHRVFSDKF